MNKKFTLLFTSVVILNSLAFAQEKTFVEHNNQRIFVEKNSFFEEFNSIDHVKYIGVSIVRPDSNKSIKYRISSMQCPKLDSVIHFDSKEINMPQTLDHIICSTYANVTAKKVKDKLKTSELIKLKLEHSNNWHDIDTNGPVQISYQTLSLKGSNAVTVIKASNSEGSDFLNVSIASQHCKDKKGTFNVYNLVGEKEFSRSFDLKYEPKTHNETIFHKILDSVCSVAK